MYLYHPETTTSFLTMLSNSDRSQTHLATTSFRSYVKTVGVTILVKLKILRLLMNLNSFWHLLKHQILLDLQFMIYFQKKMRIPSVIHHLNVKQHYSVEQISVFVVNKISGMDSYVKEVRVIIVNIISKELLSEVNQS